MVRPVKTDSKIPSVQCERPALYTRTGPEKDIATVVTANTAICLTCKNEELWLLAKIDGLSLIISFATARDRPELTISFLSVHTQKQLTHLNQLATLHRVSEMPTGNLWGNEQAQGQGPRHKPSVQQEIQNPHKQQAIRSSIHHSFRITRRSMQLYNTITRRRQIYYASKHGIPELRVIIPFFSKHDCHTVWFPLKRVSVPYVSRNRMSLIKERSHRTVCQLLVCYVQHVSCCQLFCGVECHRSRNVVAELRVL